MDIRLYLPHEKNSCLLKIIWINAQLFISCMGHGPNETVWPKFTERTSPLGFYQLCATDWSVATHVNSFVYYQIQEENTMQEMLQFCSPSPFPKIFLDAFYISIPQLMGHQWREWAEIREHMLGATVTVLWPFPCCLAIGHTGQIYDNFHKYDMPNAAQHSIITISEKTATNDF